MTQTIFILLLAAAPVFFLPETVCAASPDSLLTTPDTSLNVSVIRRTPLPLFSIPPKPPRLDSFVLHLDAPRFTPSASLSILESRVGDSIFANTSRIDWTRFAIAGGLTAGSVAIVDLYQTNAWWKDSDLRWHIQNDWQYASNFDKVGHVMGATVFTKIFSGAFHWSGFAERDALIYGATMASLYYTNIEIRDGLAKQWGFSPGDAAANLLGAWYPVLQHYVPVFQNFNFKWSYFPSGYSGAAPVIDDYDGMTLWLAIDVYGLLPKETRSHIPPWLNWLGLAVGYSVRDLRTTDAAGNVGINPDIRQEFYISLDYNLHRLIPGNSELMRTVKDVLNFVHLPAPAVRVAPGQPVFFGLFYTIGK